jgi:hypothetical protein
MNLPSKRLDRTEESSTTSLSYSNIPENILIGFGLMLVMFFANSLTLLLNLSKLILMKLQASDK